MKRLQLGALSIFLLILCSFGCQPHYDDESHWEEGPMGVLRQGLTVGEAGGCSTSIVNALSEQLITEINCLRPDTLRAFGGPNTSLGSAVFPFLQGQGPEDLTAAIESRNQTLQINSALRTLPQQFLLYRWYQQGRCNISLAARPGRSRHESGLAIDISNASSWIDTLAAHSFGWFGSRDPVHFDYQGQGTTDLAGLSVLAFQQLWNRNHSEDLIEEDGLYGPQTEARILASPAEGFDISGCEPPEVDAGVIHDMFSEADIETPLFDASAYDATVYDATVYDVYDDTTDTSLDPIDVETVPTDIDDGDILGTTTDAGTLNTQQGARLSGGCHQSVRRTPFNCLVLLIIAFSYSPRWLRSMV
jgi:hypothetical protein